MKYNIGKMRHRIKLLRQIEDSPIQPLDNAAEYQELATNIPAQRIKRLDKESVTLQATHNITRVDFVIRYRDDIDVDTFVECDGIRHNILGFESLKDDSAFMLIATSVMR